MAELPKDGILVVRLFFRRPDDLCERGGKSMFGLELTELFILATLLIPLMLLMAGIAALTLYIIYLLIRDSISHGFHLRHRKAH